MPVPARCIRPRRPRPNRITTSAGPPALRVRDLVKSYGETKALDGLSFEVPEGRFYAVLGPNGSGKTTLFRILATVLRPTSGEAWVAGHSVTREPDAVRRALGVAFQRPALDPVLTVEENLVLTAQLRGLSDPRGRALRAAAEAGVADRLDGRAGALSGGLLRRAEVARALVADPAVLLLDEPEAGLDPAAREDLVAVLRGLAPARTVVVVTHHLDTASRADRVLVLDRGRAALEGPPADLVRAAAGDAFVVAAEEGDPVARAADPRAAGEAVAAALSAAPDRPLRVHRATLADAYRAATGRAFR